MSCFARSVVMVRPAAFGSNPQTAATNVFQETAAAGREVHAAALHEFEACVQALRDRGVEVLVFDEPPDAACPDAVFPNNWFSTHAAGRMILYPMASPNRRTERRPDRIADLMQRNGYSVSEVIDLSPYENRGMYLEGTGSLVFDHAARVAYAVRSPRTNQAVAEDLCAVLGYEPFLFDAEMKGRPVYHTNVILAMGEGLAVVCEECLQGASGRQALPDRLAEGGRDVIRITKGQAASYAGNMLFLRSAAGDPLVALSTTAWRSLDEGQRKRIGSHAQPVIVDMPVIERTGGGSVRCMLAENFLARQGSTA